MAELKPRVVQITVDGNVLVWPRAKPGDYVVRQQVTCFLNEWGIEAWNQARPIQAHHFYAYTDNPGVLRAEF
jgi:hypothetical protein